MTVGICGLGLIGGSLAKAYRLSGANVLGYDLDEGICTLAMADGAINGLLVEETVAECDLVLVAVYPKAAVEYMRRIAPFVRKDAMLIDCCGTKRLVCEEGFRLAREYGYTYIGGHPMAGREFSGFSYSKDDLFEQASMILTPAPEATIEERQWAKEFFLSIGFLRVRFTTPEDHDEIIGYTSQMAHVVSSAYVKTPMALKHKGFSAGSFQDMTRVARLNEDMWTELFMDNREPLIREVQGMIDRMVEYRDALTDGDEERLMTLLREGREMKEMLDE